MIDIGPALRDEIAAIAGVSAIVGANPTGTARVRLDEPAPGDATVPYRAFIVVEDLGPHRHPRLPVADWSFSTKMYGRTATEAKTLYGLVSDGLHGIGPRVNASRIGIYVSHEESAEGVRKDPDTSQPYVDATISLTAPTTAVPA